MLEPLLIAMITSTPLCISTTVCTTAPPSNTRDAPCVRLVSPEVTAASWSARSWGKPALNASGSPSEDTTTACATSGTRSTKLVISQLRSCAGRPGVLMGTPLVARSYRFLLVDSLCLGLQNPSVLRLLDLGGCSGAALAHASLEAGHPGPGRIRRSGGCVGFGLAASAADRARYEVSPRHPLRQTRLGGISRRRRRERLGGTPAFVGGRSPRRPGGPLGGRGPPGGRGPLGGSWAPGRADALAAAAEPVGLERVVDRQPLILDSGRRNRHLAGVGRAVGPLPAVRPGVARAGTVAAPDVLAADRRLGDHGRLRWCLPAERGQPAGSGRWPGAWRTGRRDGDPWAQLVRTVIGRTSRGRGAVGLPAHRERLRRLAIGRAVPGARSGARSGVRGRGEG